MKLSVEVKKTQMRDIVKILQSGSVRIECGFTFEDGRPPSSREVSSIYESSNK